MSKPQRYLLIRDDVEHALEIRSGLQREFVWTVNGVEVLRQKSSDEKATLRGGEHGALRVVLTTLGRPRRAIWYADPADPQLLLGTGGTDLHPEPGSKAALREDKILAHPTRHTVVQTVGAAGAVVAVPVALYLLTQLLGMIPRPDLPRIPWPDLPSIPWPDLPRFPWPDLPDVNLPDVPEWAKWILAHTKYVVPVIVALVIARGEIRRRRDRELAEATAQASRPE